MNGGKCRMLKKISSFVHDSEHGHYFRVSNSHQLDIVANFSTTNSANMQLH